MSSSEPAKGNGDFRKKPRRTYTQEQKQAVLDAYKKANAEAPVQINDWCKQQGINPSQFYSWRRHMKMKTGKALRLARNNKNAAPDHERDIAALAKLNTQPVRVDALPLLVNKTGDAALDERLGTVLGATIAEIIKRLRP